MHVRCHNLNIEFVINCEMQKHMRQENVFASETHFHKWGRVQEIEPNDSQVHFHFGGYICARVVNILSFRWKGKQAPT